MDCRRHFGALHRTVRWLAVAATLAVVGIDAASAQPQLPAPPKLLARSPTPPESRGASVATGFFVDGAGRVMTARHVVDDCTRVAVAKEGHWLAARVVALDPRYDLGLVQVAKTLGLAAVFPRNVTSADNQMMFASDYDKLEDMIRRGGAMANAMVTGGAEPGHIALRSDASFGSSGAPVLDARGLVAGVVSRKNASWSPVVTIGSAVYQQHVTAVAAAEAKAFLSANGIALQQDDRAQLSGTASRAHRAASISVRVFCFKG